MRRVNSQQLPRMMTGLSAMSLLIWLTVTRYAGNNGDLLFILLASVFLFAFCATDTLYAKIPNSLTLALAIAGASFQFLTAGSAGLLSATLGLLTGLALLIVPYTLGGMGGGDVKALASLGALLGPFSILQVFLYMGLMGGLLALLHYLMEDSLHERAVAWGLAFKTMVYTRDPRALLPSRNGDKLRFPYAAAIAFGFFAFQQWGRLV